MSMDQKFRFVAPVFIFVFVLTSCAPSQPQQTVPADSIYSGLTDEEDGTLEADIDLNAPLVDVTDESAGTDGLSGIVGGGSPRTGYLLVRASGNETINQQDSRRPRTMASVTKLATSLAALRNVPGISVGAVAAMLRSSDNHAASIFLRKFAKAVAGLDLPAPRVKNPHSCSGNSSADAPAARLVLNWLDKTVAGDWSGASLVDGNGCNQNDKFSPEQLVNLLRYADSLGPAFGGQEFASLLAKGGSSGTLRSRLSNLEGRARVFAKTGTLRSAITLAGYLFVPTGKGAQKYYFAILSEINSMGEARQGRARIDALIKSWAHSLAK